MVIGLLAIVALSNQFLGTGDLAANKSDGHSHDHDEDAMEAQGEPVELPAPMGSPDASVKVNVYVTSDNACDVSTLDAMTEIAHKFGGDAVYVTFKDLLDEQVQAEAHAAKISCLSGITINGQSQFILPERGLTGTVMLDGPVGEINYDKTDVEAIIRHLLSTKEDADDS